MSGNDIVIDSNVIIDASKGIIDFKKLLYEFDQIYISVITYIEVLGYDFINDNEKEKIKKFLTNFFF